MYSVKIRNKNTTYRTIFRAFLALRAERIINRSKVVNNLDSSRGAIFFTLFASDAGIRALLTSHSTLILIATGHHDPLNVCHKTDYSSWAGACTQTATDTFSRIDMSHSVLNADGTLGAYLDTVAKPDTTENTFSTAAVHCLRCLTRANTDVVHFVCGMLAVTVTANYRNLLNNVLKFHSEYIGNLLCRSISARNAKIGFYFRFLTKSLSIAVTARISASSAVSTR